MPPDELFDVEPEDTEEALMAATYRALCEHGYAELTIERIGAEFEKSPSLLYHHYGGKDELLVAFLEYMLERFEADVSFGTADDPWQKLQQLVEHALAPTRDERHREFTSAMIELRAQAAHDPEYRAAFTRHDRLFADRLASIVREGVEAGRFRDVDPEGVASLVQTTVNGAMLQRATTDSDAGGFDVADVRRELSVVLTDRLLREGGE